ncbi:MAG: hypothetical protein EB075_04480 [Bacteroidetes bacterium]|nr:hypothetical protein [Bacteroidota bacterium]
MSSVLKQYLPSLAWLPAYRASENLRGDVSAGLTVGVMLIPQGMAYALIAGLPPIYGLYAALVPLVVYALLGTSRQLAVGPVAMVSLLVAAAGVETVVQPGGSIKDQESIDAANSANICSLICQVQRWSHS